MFFVEAIIEVNPQLMEALIFENFIFWSGELKLIESWRTAISLIQILIILIRFIPQVDMRAKLSLIDIATLVRQRFGTSPFAQFFCCFITVFI